MPIEFDNNFTLAKARATRDKYFVYGDNDQYIGIGGTAIVRSCWNSIGLRTKKSPKSNDGAYWTDETYTTNCAKINYDLSYIEVFLLRGATLVFPEKMIGTGLSQLDKRAPKTFKYLKHKLEILFEKYAERGDKA